MGFISDFLLCVSSMCRGEFIIKIIKITTLGSSFAPSQHLHEAKSQIPGVLSPLESEQSDAADGGRKISTETPQKAEL